MDKIELGTALKDRHGAFTDYIGGLPEEDYGYHREAKWNAAQQLDHIVQSVKRVDMAFGLPLFVLETKFGVSHRTSIAYESLVDNYLTVLKQNPGFKTPQEFAPSNIPWTARETHRSLLNKLVGSLVSRLDGLSEQDLDRYLLPHPLLGKLTLREMAFFTLYHVQHHHRQIVANLSARTHAQKS